MNNKDRTSSFEPIAMGQRIKKQRTILGLSREKLAEQSNITPRYCYDIELGLKNMSTETLCHIASALNLSTDYILFGEQCDDDAYIPAISLVKTCQESHLHHLEQIISHYILAISSTCTPNQE